MVKRCWSGEKGESKSNTSYYNQTELYKLKKRERKAMPSASDYSRARKEMIVPLFVEFVTYFLVPIRGKQDTDSIMIANMASFDEMQFTSDSEAWALWVLADKERVWQAQGDSQLVLPEAKWTESGVFKQAGCPFGLEGSTAMEGFFDLVDKEREKQHNDRILLKAVKEYHRSLVTDKLMKRTTSKEARQLRQEQEEQNVLLRSKKSVKKSTEWAEFYDIVAEAV